MARTRWARRLSCVSPTTVPLARPSQYGAPSPENAGTTYTPSGESADSATAPEAAASSMTPTSTSYSMAAPVV